MPTTITEAKSKLKQVTPQWLKESYGWLVKNEKSGGCCHIPFAEDEENVFSVCLGWHDAGANRVQLPDGAWGPDPKRPDDDGYRIAWKIGIQSRDNCMQCDLDVDFEMPYDEKTGNVDDTLTVFDFRPSTRKELTSVAAEMKRTALRVMKDWCGKSTADRAES